MNCNEQEKKMSIQLKGEAKPQMHALLHESNKHAYKNISTTKHTFLFSLFHSSSLFLCALHAHFVIMDFRWQIFRWCCTARTWKRWICVQFFLCLRALRFASLAVYLPNFIVILGENILRLTIPILVWDNTNNNKKKEMQHTKRAEKKKFIVIFILFSFSYFILLSILVIYSSFFSVLFFVLIPFFRLNIVQACYVPSL